jgi:hypothetical protein
MPAVASTWHLVTYCTVCVLWLWYTLYFIKLQRKNSHVFMPGAPAGNANRPPLISNYLDNFCSCTTQISSPMCGCIPSCLSTCLLVKRGTASKTAVFHFLEHPCNKQLLKCPSIKIVWQGHFSNFLSKNLLKMIISGEFCWNNGENSICCKYHIQTEP